MGTQELLLEPLTASAGVEAKVWLGHCAGEYVSACALTAQGLKKLGL